MKKTIRLAVLTLAAVMAAQVQAQSRNRLQPARNSARSTAPARDAATEKANAEARASAVAENSEGQTSDIFIPEGTDIDIAYMIYGQLIGKTVLPDPSTPDAKIKLISLPGQKLSKEDQIAAFEAAFEMNGIHMEPYGEGDDESKKFVRALPRDKARGEAIPVVIDEEAVIPDSSRVYSVMISFKNIPIDEAKTVLEGLKSPKGLLLVYERIGKILVTDTGLNVNSMRKVAKEIDVATPINENVFVRQIKHAAAADIKNAIQAIVDESQKELEKMSKAAAQGTSNSSTAAGTPRAPLLRRPGQPGNQTPATPPANVESMVASVSDADRGMIRGKVIITTDERSNKLIFITSKTNMDFFDKIIEELDVETTPDVEVKVVRLKYAEAKNVSEMINDLIGNSSSSNNSSKNQNQNASAGSNRNLSRNSSSSQSSTPQQRSSVNQRSGEEKTGELSKDNCTVLADERINGLVVMCNKEVWPAVKEIIERMDIKLSQVLIETAIIEVTLGDDLQTGIDWVQRGRQKVWAQQNVVDQYGRKAYYTLDDNGNINGTSFTDDSSGLPVMKTVKSLVRDGFVNNGSYALGGGGGTASALLNTVVGVGSNATEAVFGGANPIGSGVSYFLKSDKLNLAAIIQASKTDTHTKYIASPVIMTVDNKEATIDATENRQFLTGWSAQSGSYGNSGQPTPNYTAKDIGIKVKTTPKINPNGTVMLKVEAEYSQYSKDGQSMLIPENGAYKQGKVDLAVERKLSADVFLDNMQTVVFGGLAETVVSESETGIPILKDIPWIGKWLFGSVSKTEARKELLVFMTPYVLDDADSAQAEARRRMNAMSDARPWDNGLGWSASPLADPVAEKDRLRRLKEEAKKRDEDRKARLAIEMWKLDRAKELEKMTQAERRAWFEKYREELESEEKETFDEKVEGYSQEDLQALAASIREKKLAEANAVIKEDDTFKDELRAETNGSPAAPAEPKTDEEK